MARTRWPPDPWTPASCPGQADQSATPTGARTWNRLTDRLTDKYKDSQAQHLPI